MNVLATQITNPAGRYLFSNLNVPGSYYIRVISPKGYLFSPQHKVSNSGIYSAVNENGLSNLLTLQYGQNINSINAGLCISCLCGSAEGIMESAADQEMSLSYIAEAANRSVQMALNSNPSKCQYEKIRYIASRTNNTINMFGDILGMQQNTVNAILRQN